MRWLNAARSERPSDEDDEEALKDLVESGLRLIFKKYLKNLCTLLKCSRILETDWQSLLTIDIKNTNDYAYKRQILVFSSSYLLLGPLHK